MGLELSATPSIEDIDYPDEFESYEEAVEWGRARQTLNTVNVWQIGWAASRIPTEYGDQTLERWAEECQFDPSTVGRWRWVAQWWTKEEVRQFGEGLSFGHFEAVTTLKQRDLEEAYDLLERARTAEPRWSIRKLKQALNGQDPDNPAPAEENAENAGDASRQVLNARGVLEVVDINGRPAIALILERDADELLTRFEEAGLNGEYVRGLFQTISTAAA